MRDVLDETRGELSWLTQNGIVGLAGEHCRFIRRTNGPLAPEANERGIVVAATTESSTEVLAEVFDELVSKIAEIVTVVGQEQANLLLSAIDELRAKLVTTIKSAAVTPSADTELSAPKSSPEATAQIPATSSEPRRLF